MSWSEALVEISKYLAASGIVGVGGVVFATVWSQRHDLRKDELLDGRLRERDWREFQKTTVVELQDIMWELREQVDGIQLERDLVRMGHLHVSAVKEGVEKAQGQLRRVEVLTTRIEDDDLRSCAERLRYHAYNAFQMIDEPKKPEQMQSHLDKFTMEYNESFRIQTRKVLKEIIAREN